MKIIEAKRLNKVSEYYFSKKLREINEINQKGIQVINLGIGSPDLEPPKVVINELKTWSSQNNVHGYQRYNGIPELRLAIKEWSKKVYDIDLNAETEILPLMGSKEGIYHITQAFVNTGDKVLVPMLGYPTYRSVSNLAQAIVAEYSIKSDGSFDLDELSSLLSGNTKVLWLNYPHMPTGTPANKKAITQLIALANENGCIVINDNPYSTLLTDDYFSIFQIDGAKENCLELNSLSKSHNMSGWRIGWVSGKTELIQSILKVKSNMDSGMFLPIQKAAISALNVSTDWIKQLNLIYSERRKVVWKILDELNCSYSKNNVGLFVWARIPDRSDSGEIWTNEILDKAKVFITPGFIFGTSGNKFIRVSLCNSTDVLGEALNRINNLK
ncbi:MAG: aminotransferase class I/II-fold pyridoxal phosphate-dependent enzyme [Flavobacteriales bacterium]|nr:aminotransferase class I/II-fold pyridoxal phosphate-dependent enzyme [Flavobacteriales bacterium]